MIVPDRFENSRLLGSYVPFITEEETEPLFSLEMAVGDFSEPENLIQVFNDEAPFLWIYEGWSFGFSFTTERPAALLVFDREDGKNIWTKGHICIKPHTSFSEADSAVSNAMMLMYAYNTGWHDTLMLHASCPMKDGMGYVFLGKSGTGKSTHSRMWMENIPEVELLNDDNPVVRVIDGKAIVYGTPWSGKTPCYKNKSVPLHGIVRIVRAPYNKANRLGMLQSYACLLPSCSCMKWDEEWVDRQHETVEKVISAVACWDMECLPDADAALTCYKAVSE